MPPGTIMYHPTSLAESPSFSVSFFAGLLNVPAQQAHTTLPCRLFSVSFRQGPATQLEDPLHIGKAFPCAVKHGHDMTVER